MALPNASATLQALLPEWQGLLQGWAADGRLTAAAQEALMLQEEPRALRRLVKRWAAGDFRDLPPVVLLSASDMPGAMGAYAISTGTIYLNQEWLWGASREQIVAVLTEELGHHLDGVVNEGDTPGDEGEYFSRLQLLSGGTLGELEKISLRSQVDSGLVMAGQEEVAAEYTAAPIIRGNSIYTILDGPSWTQAEANAVKLGGHLASIQSKEENDLIQSIAKMNTDPLLTWIGGTDRDLEGTWEWVDSNPWQYTNWSQSEPTNNAWAAGIPENYLAIYKSDGTWNDNMEGNWSEYATTRGIAEIPFIRRGNSAYVIVQGPSWEEAEANAVKLGGHLATINDADENQWLIREFPSPPGQPFWYVYWIGLNDVAREGDFIWASGELTSFANWRSTAGPNRPPYDAANDPYDYGILQPNDINESQAGEWSELDNNYFTRTPGSAGGVGIAEIPLAPNNLPTGAPTLTGTPRPGQILTLNPAPIQDIDNFEGWTPTYDYAWEVSSNNGSTWSRLTSTDASDNNSSYTLTAADLGKRIRGVVSYLDGYGTVETVASTSALVTTGAVDTGDASFAINGSPAAGQTLAVIQTANDPDGNGGAFSYQWFSSADGSQWSAIAGASASTWVVTSALSGKQVRAQVSYTDGKGISEQIVTSSVAIAGSPGVTVRSISGSGGTSETGDQAVYSFQLNARPRDPVSLVFTLSDASEASLSASSLTFSPEAWNTPQTLTLTGRDDFLDDGDISYVVSTRVSSVDPNYGQRVDGTGGVAVANLQLLNRDDGQDGDQTLYGDNGGGQVVNDDLLGNNGRDRLYGLLGRDRLRGGRNDDRIYGGLDDDLLYGEDGHDQLFGEQDDDVLEGGAGNDRLTGGEGADTLIGGSGNDIYVIDDELDRLEDRGLATDVDSVIIRANLSAYVLGAGLENASLEGTTAASLTGNSLSNALTGNAAPNVLNGGAGADRLAGGLGDDTYIVDNSADVVTEASGSGSDRINSFVSLSLAANTEILALQGSAAINGTGNAAANTLIGNAANNILNGGAGADTMRGGAGNDVYVVDSAADVIVEAAATGVDRINSFVSLNLAANTEILALQGTAAINGTGNAAANTLIGNGASNILDGGAGGRDVLTGQAGSDRFQFSSRPGSFLSANADRLSDFNASQGDRLRISRTAFGITATTASLTSVSSSTAQATALSTTALFVYNTSTGELLWNQNGAAAGAGTGGVLAVLSNRAPLSAGAIQLV